MKKFIKNNIVGFMLGAVIFSSITVAAYTIFANDIGYTPKDSTWKKSNGEDITNVKDAIDELYSKSRSLKKISELKPGINTINGNTNKNLYVALIGMTSASGASEIVNSRTQIKSITGADSEEIFYSFDSESSFGIRLYKLTNCQETITVESNVHTSGNAKIIFFGN